jgi:hypothetical protein
MRIRANIYNALESEGDKKAKEILPPYTEPSVLHNVKLHTT